MASRKTIMKKKLLSVASMVLRVAARRAAKAKREKLAGVRRMLLQDAKDMHAIASLVKRDKVRQAIKAAWMMDTEPRETLPAAFWKLSPDSADFENFIGPKARRARKASPWWTPSKRLAKHITVTNLAPVKKYKCFHCGRPTSMTTTPLQGGRYYPSHCSRPACLNALTPRKRRVDRDPMSGIGKTGDSATWKKRRAKTAWGVYIDGEVYGWYGDKGQAREAARELRLREPRAKVDIRTKKSKTVRLGYFYKKKGVGRQKRSGAYGFSKYLYGDRYRYRSGRDPSPSTIRHFPDSDAAIDFANKHLGFEYRIIERSPGRVRLQGNDKRYTLTWPARGQR